MTMSYFDGMTDEQISALTDEQVTKTINLACAEQGIPVFLDDLGGPPKPEVSPDREFFKVGNWIVDTREDASAILGAVLASTRRKTGYDFYRDGQELQAKIDESEEKIETVKLFTPEQFTRHQATIKGHAVRTAAWKTQNEARTKAAEKRSSVCMEVWSVVDEARARIRDAARLESLFLKYVELADGNRDVARKFLIRAEHLDDNWREAGAEKVEEREYANV